MWAKTIFKISTRHSRLNTRSGPGGTVIGESEVVTRGSSPIIYFPDCHLEFFIIFTASLSAFFSQVLPTSSACLTLMMVMTTTQAVETQIGNLYDYGAHGGRSIKCVRTEYARRVIENDSALTMSCTGL